MVSNTQSERYYYWVGPEIQHLALKATSNVLIGLFNKNEEEKHRSANNIGWGI